MIWSCGCVVPSACHKILMYLQCTLIFHRMAFLCTIRLVALGFHLCGSWVGHRITVGQNHLARMHVNSRKLSETVITKIQRVQNSFIRLTFRFRKYVSARLLHQASGLPYVRERLITVGQNHLARMHVNLPVEHTINSARTNIAWDKYKTPIPILKPPN